MLSDNRYTLPAELGGGEVEVLHGLARDDGRVNCRLPAGAVIALPFSLLTPVKPPPLPPEPSISAVVLDGRGLVWQRTHRGVWECFEEDISADWAGLCASYSPSQPPIPLVPDPAAVPVELP